MSATIAAPPANAPAPKLLTAEEFFLLPDDGNQHELVRGKVITMPPPGFLHGVVQFRVGRILDDHARTQPRGIITMESGVITERKPDSVRGPDVAYWDVARDRPEDYPASYLDQAPLLCVEVLSPNNKRKELEEKLREYFGRGVKMVWIISPEDRTATVYRQPDQGQLFHQNASLTGEEVLPGFTCAVAEFFS